MANLLTIGLRLCFSGMSGRRRREQNNTLAETKSSRGFLECARKTCQPHPERTLSEAKRQSKG
ncbi:MAG: hypothetical protein RMK99_16180, partial [Anaerolineales bacterium]|nr:hypothetical protein [Anaerolineales bacterium]